MKLLLILSIFVVYSFSDLVSLDKTGGNGYYTNSITLTNSPTILSANGTFGVGIFSIKNDKLVSLSTALSSINVKDLAVDSSEKYLYAGCDTSGLYILDISDIYTPTTVSTITDGGQIIDVFVDKTKKILLTANDSNGVKIYDIETPNTPILKATMILNTGVKKVAMMDDFLSIGYVDGTLEIYNVTDISNPVKKYTFSNFSSIEDLGFYNGNFVVVDRTSGIFVYNIEHLDLPILKANFPVGNGAGFTSKDDSVYLTTKDSVIYTLSGGEALKLQFISSKALDSYANSIVFYDNYLIASKLDRSLELLKEKTSSCSDGIVYGQNPLTSNWVKFFSGCDVPSGWIVSQEVPTQIASQERPSYTTEDIKALDRGWHLLGTGSKIDDFSIFDNANSVWKYKNNQWYAYSPNSTLNDRIRVSGSYTPLTTIEAGMGFWIEIK